MSTSTLATVSFWRVLAERTGRQAAQTAVPLLAAIVAAGGQVDVVNVSLALGMQVAVVAGKAAMQGLVDVRVAPDSALGWQLLDRAVPAAAGVYVGLWPVTGSGFATFDVRSASGAAGGAALTAVVTYFSNPPQFTHAAAFRAAA